VLFRSGGEPENAEEEYAELTYENPLLDWRTI
jgi:hypothetical protein